MGYRGVIIPSSADTRIELQLHPIHSDYQLYLKDHKEILPHGLKHSNPFEGKNAKFHMIQFNMFQTAALVSQSGKLF